ncbi:hypothetical protein JHK85_050213 [Glycine max]|nr:hypothetical protein JHK85_050213 [Glycine max]
MAKQNKEHIYSLKECGHGGEEEDREEERGSLWRKEETCWLEREKKAIKKRRKLLPSPAVEAQGNTVRALKASKAAQPEIDAAIEALNALKLEKSSIERSLLGGSDCRKAFRQSVVNTLERRLFYIPSFKIYRGVAGLFDYGPPGCSVKSNVLSFWRQHFVLEENMVEVDCPCVTPEIVLKASRWWVS